MASKYLITFDIVDGENKDYDDIFNMIDTKYDANILSGYIRLSSLSTVYLIKTNLTADELRDMFHNVISKTTYVIVVKYISCAWSLQEPDSVYLKKKNY